MARTTTGVARAAKPLGEVSTDVFKEGDATESAGVIADVACFVTLRSWESCHGRLRLYGMDDEFGRMAGPMDYSGHPGQLFI